MLSEFSHAVHFFAPICNELDHTHIFKHLAHSTITIAKDFIAHKVLKLNHLCTLLSRLNGTFQTTENMQLSNK